MPYNKFFLLSPPSRLRFFHRYVVALLSLGYSSNSGSRGGLQVLTTHKFLYALTFLRLISPFGALRRSLINQNLVAVTVVEVARRDNLPVKERTYI